MSVSREYLSFSDSIRVNGDRHKANAERYLAEGNVAFAAGAMRKADRNYAKADRIDAFLKRPEDATIREVYELTLAAITRNLYGTLK